MIKEIQFCILRSKCVPDYSSSCCSLNNYVWLLRSQLHNLAFIIFRVLLLFIIYCSMSLSPFYLCCIMSTITYY